MDYLIAKSNKTVTRGTAKKGDSITSKLRLVSLLQNGFLIRQYL